MKKTEKTFKHVIIDANNPANPHCKANWWERWDGFHSRLEKT